MDEHPTSVGAQAHDLPDQHPSLAKMMCAEASGTYVLVLLGCGAVHAATLFGAQSGLWQVAIVWAVAIMIAIYLTGSISGAHLNPAVTIALSVWQRHRWSRVAPYILAQVFGAFLAAATLYYLFAGVLAYYEEVKHVVRGEPGSIVTAMCYGEYYPNPGSVASATAPFDMAAYERLQSCVPMFAAFGAELLGTALLAAVIFAVTDTRNQVAPQANLAPVFVGLTVAALISVIAPLTQACFNPARDFGPRLFAYFAGWGTVALPGSDSHSWLTVYILAPIIGAIIGGGWYQSSMRRPQ
ncbi:MAG: aquaporin family protein [Planctomycetales bacterium]|nr:aquaporin family protein [Planctomycetales bacterium]